MVKPAIKTAVVGLGRWGKNVARELNAVSSVVGYTTSNEASQAWASEHLSLARLLTLDEMCADTSIQAVAIATPAATHAQIAHALLSSGKHMFVEKPLALSSKEASLLGSLAYSKKKILMTGYIFLFHPLYQRLKKELSLQNIERVGLQWKKYGTFGESIEWSLLTHHLSLFLDLFGNPRAGSVHFDKGVQSDHDSVETRVVYEDFECFSFIDRASPQSEHSITVEYKDKTVEKYVLEPTRGPLQREMAAFISSIGGSSTPPTAYHFGEQVLKLHELLRRE